MGVKQHNAAIIAPLIPSFSSIVFLTMAYFLTLDG